MVVVANEGRRQRADFEPGRLSRTTLSGIEAIGIKLRLHSISSVSIASIMHEDVRKIGGTVDTADSGGHSESDVDCSRSKVLGRRSGDRSGPRLLPKTLPAQSGPKPYCIQPAPQEGTENHRQTLSIDGMHKVRALHCVGIVFNRRERTDLKKLSQTTEAA